MISRNTVCDGDELSHLDEASLLYQLPTINCKSYPEEKATKKVIRQVRLLFFAVIMLSVAMTIITWVGTCKLYAMQKLVVDFSLRKTIFNYTDLRHMLGNINDKGKIDFVYGFHDSLLQSITYWDQPTIHANRNRTRRKSGGRRPTKKIDSSLRSRSSRDGSNVNEGTVNNMPDDWLWISSHSRIPVSIFTHSTCHNVHE